MEESENLEKTNILKCLYLFVPQRHKLVLLPQKDYKEKVKRDMMNFIEKKWVRGGDVILKDVQEVFQKPPYNLSDRTVRLYLMELVEEKKITTWKKEGNRYYAPKLSMPFKVIISSIAVILLIGMSVDLFLSDDMIINYIYFGHPESTLPLVVYSIVVATIYTTLWTVIWTKTERRLKHAS